ncbi:MAG: Kazal domain-containing protein [Methylocystis sp.]|nr:Kazal domain-containing protein [Methylocystis sp.]
MSRKNVIFLALAGAMAGANSGAAWAAGVGAACGGIAGIQCDGKLWCMPDACGATIGKCIELPFVCPRIVSQECGCDNKTYTNGCEREKAKVAKKSEGACKEDYK